MKRFLGLAIGLFSVIGFTSSAEAIRIKNAEVQNGVAFIKGSDAAGRSAITWEGQFATTANPGGAFSFNGVVPADCVGTLSDGVSTIDVVVLDCTPVSVAPAPVPRTGQVLCYDDQYGTIVNCSGTGQDGALQKGVAWPTPRLTDNNNGTITDNLTGLIWLKNANCPGGFRIWPGFDVNAVRQGLNDVAQLNTDGTMNGNNCGDTSNGGSHQTDWRLPNLRELYSLVHFGASGSLALPPGNQFLNFQACYWSSTSLDNATFPGQAYFVIFLDRGVVGNTGKDGGGGCGYIIAVRGGS